MFIHFQSLQWFYFRSGIINWKDVYLHYWVIWITFVQFAFIKNIHGFYRVPTIKLSEFGIGKVGHVCPYWPVTTTTSCPLNSIQLKIWLCPLLWIKPFVFGILQIFAQRTRLDQAPVLALHQFPVQVVLEISRDHKGWTYSVQLVHRSNMFWKAMIVASIGLLSIHPCPWLSQLLMIDK